ncbi:hypothetical protein L2E82_02181 [Cichorium intybus]|uniref:Uncharacterized protein n=1 Tax=Cichorium intybus TaxID=13427 RepID=A0ACB9H1R4_CICIN|nr:hypothetical protein L2E82_02181 [Cichorium intybus]
MERRGLPSIYSHKVKSGFTICSICFYSGVPVTPSSAINAPLSFSSSLLLKHTSILHSNLTISITNPPATKFYNTFILPLSPNFKRGSIINMGLSPYSNPSDAGILCVFLVKIAMAISFMKEILRSILKVVGIRFPSWEEVPDQGFTESPECRGTPSTSYMEEFRSRTPTLRYDSLSCLAKQECSVCLIEFKPDAEINHLSCGHVFHKSCVEKWLNYWNITCPLCRNHMMAPLESEENTCPM